MGKLWFVRLNDSHANVWILLLYKSKVDLLSIILWCYSANIYFVKESAIVTMAIQRQYNGRN